jgi:HAD superfamily hydrolase (TIGR01484 family)
MMRPIQELPASAAANLLGLFFDIDDTFTHHGKIPRSAFEALWLARESGLKLVPVTGRPAGWCDHIARMWPVDGVVGENGAFYFCYDEEAGRLRKRFADPEETLHKKRGRLEAVKTEILHAVPGAALSTDQAYRETDLAIDYCEDVPPLPWAEVERICGIFEKHGASCKVSSIHVKGWFGDYSKLEMAKILAAERWGLDPDDTRKRFLYCGDSPNDEPMFAYFPYSAGVKNIERFKERMEHLPAFVAEREGGEGFAEIVKVLLQARRS